MSPSIPYLPLIQFTTTRFVWFTAKYICFYFNHRVCPTQRIDSFTLSSFYYGLTLIGIEKIRVVFSLTCLNFVIILFNSLEVSHLNFINTPLNFKVSHFDISNFYFISNSLIPLNIVVQLNGKMKKIIIITKGILIISYPFVRI